MQSFKHIDVAGTATLMQQGAKVFDIRDPDSFAQSHIPGSAHLTNNNLQQVITELSTDTPVVICCYHGISSQQAAQYFVAQGFDDVYSMDGGFEAWKQSMPSESA
ncbi:thiosulfate sulfurtransferase GlpE [Planctobacterium marinum]|uniref:thiosulfate sulfurtransferase GlpE n=1 Tax=Planctobacterium marinum TaxID=1631968 RepID=UPI001E349395|nr:thiosulfate sulfurtransferase GlpE [Planctobacterium marinum]MCC2606441.1 thiosulfate sulfurtransferase GlpE [Planctobacterium marinum]